LANGASGGIITRFAGSSGSFGAPTHGPALNSTFLSPAAVYADGQGDVYVADEPAVEVCPPHFIDPTCTPPLPQGSVAKVSAPDGTLSIIANNSNGLGQVAAVTGDANGDLYVANTSTGVVNVNEIAANGTVSVIAGGGGNTPSTTPQSATSVQLGYPDGVAVDANGDVFIADDGADSVVYEVTAGELTVVAGGGGSAPSTTPQSATTVQLAGPQGVAVDSAGNLYIADGQGRADDDAVEKVTPAGQLSVIAGGGAGQPSTTPQAATSVALGDPGGIAVDADGNLYIADDVDNVVEEVTPGGELSIIAGNSSFDSGAPTYNGPATASLLHRPTGVSVAANGMLYIADRGNATIDAVTPLEPQSTLAPVITGNAVEGQTLTADTGTWTNDPSSFSYSYQWEDCDSHGNNCVNINGATSTTYTLAAGDVEQTVEVVVTATNVSGSTPASSAPTSAVIPPAPTNSVAPAISGTAQQGQTLTASTGTWSDSSATFSYQWQDCHSGTCTNISPGGTASTYTPVAGDVGDTVDVVVTATNAGGSTSATSLATSLVRALPSPTPTPTPVSTAPPVISGTVAVGHTLSVSTGQWSANATGFQYQWLRDGVPISGATHSTYTVQTADQGHALTCTVTASDGSSASASTSSATSPGVTIPISNVQACPQPTGLLSGTTLGPLTLGLTRARARQMLPLFKASSYHTDNFCLSGGWGIRVGYASARLLGSTTDAGEAAISGKVVLALTANPFYALHGVKPGTRLQSAKRRFKLGKVMQLGLNDWYMLPGATSNGVLKVRHGIIQEVGIANKGLTATRAAQARLLRSF
jgi:sugar lactone lactonase YvrE